MHDVAIFRNIGYLSSHSIRGIEKEGLWSLGLFPKAIDHSSGVQWSERLRVIKSDSLTNLPERAGKPNIDTCES